MWLVRIALGRPYTFVVMAVLIVLLGVVTIGQMQTDILPEIEIPVVAVVWNYGGLPPDEMEKRVVTNFERLVTTTVNDIEHTESQTLTGVPRARFTLPGSAISATKEGVRVAVLGPGHRIHWSRVTIERDDGAEVEISEGVTEADSVVASPSPGLVEGAVVEAIH
jgi:AcrB/AcrD/AcrF family